MSGYVDAFFTHVLDYINIFFQIDIIMYLLSFFIIISILGLLRKLLKINS